MNFYKVIAKCGHVGKTRYYKGVFYLKAENGKDAAAKARQLPRVKHNHKDAILAVQKVGYDEFITGKKEQSENPYFKCKNSTEQKLIVDKIAKDIYTETNIEQHRKSKDDRLAKLAVLRRMFRKENKYSFAEAA
jgi:hypothetical protein